MSWIPFAVCAGVLLLVVLWAVLAYNRLQALQYACDDAWSLTDVQLQRRADLVPQLVAVVQGYAAHERAILEEVTAARAEASPLHGPSAEHLAAETRLTAGIGSVVVLREQYPELKASEQFLALQQTLSDLETQIAASREIYNSNVVAYRDAMQQVPSAWIAQRFAFKDRPMFAAPGLDAPAVAGGLR